MLLNQSWHWLIMKKIIQLYFLASVIKKRLCQLFCEITCIQCTPSPLYSCQPTAIEWLMHCAKLMLIWLHCFELHPFTLAPPRSSQEMIKLVQLDTSVAPAMPKLVLTNYYRNTLLLCILEYFASVQSGHQKAALYVDQFIDIIQLFIGESHHHLCEPTSLINVVEIDQTDRR